MRTDTLLRSALATIGVVVCGQIHAACDERIAVGGDISPQEVAERIRSQLSDSDFPCAIERARSWQITIPTLAPEDQVNSRFALRALALTTAADASYPVDTRLALLNLAVTPSFANPSEDDLRADARTLLLGAREFQAQNEPYAHLEALIEALGRDRRLPHGARAIDRGDVTQIIPGPNGREFLPQLIALAEISRGDMAMMWLREVLASVLYSSMSVWNETDRPEEIETRAGGVLKLTELLIDVPSCYGCGDKWYWRPVMVAGTAYQRLGRKDLADREIRRALSIVRSIEDREQRLYRLNFALIDLLISRYDKNVIVEVVLEIQQLAYSMDTPTARETRGRLPETIKRWKIDVSPPSGDR